MSTKYLAKVVYDVNYLNGGGTGIGPTASGQEFENEQAAREFMSKLAPNTRPSISKIEYWGPEDPQWGWTRKFVRVAH